MSLNLPSLAWHRVVSQRKQQTAGECWHAIVERTGQTKSSYCAAELMAVHLVFRVSRSLIVVTTLHLRLWKLSTVVHVCYRHHPTRELKPQQPHGVMVKSVETKERAIRRIGTYERINYCIFWWQWSSEVWLVNLVDQLLPIQSVFTEKPRNWKSKGSERNIFTQRLQNKFLFVNVCDRGSGQNF